MGYGEAWNREKPEAQIEKSIVRRRFCRNDVDYPTVDLLLGLADVLNLAIRPD